MDKNKSFKIDATKYMETMGYELHSHSSDYETLIFTYSDMEDDNWDTKPTIYCRINGEKKTMELKNSFKLFIQITTGEIQYKHPDISNFMRKMEIYACSCKLADETIK
jgi:hypothetical protein